MGWPRIQLHPSTHRRRDIKSVPPSPPPIPAHLTALLPVPISVFIIVGALSFALSTRVRGICSFALKFIINPFEDVDLGADEIAAPTGGSQGGSGQQRRPTRRIRTYRNARKRDDLYGMENDFWQDHRDKLDVEYVIPVHNRFLDKETRKSGQGRRRRNLG
jgi:hypothetical protein